MSNLPADFSFSQNSLQDYFDCPRRFELRHMLHREWPALQSEPVIEMEHKADLGRRFHEMVYQSQVGISPEKIAEQTKDAELLSWWEEFSRSTILLNLPAARRAEFTLSTPFNGARLLAKYDLLCVEPGGRAVIVDWKTSNKPASATILASRLQSRVYPLLLVESGKTLNHGQPISPEKIELIYWFTSDPEHPIQFKYNRKQYQADKAYLSTMIQEIVARPEGNYPLTQDEKKCAYCVYRSLCNRGIRAGNANDDPELEQDLAQPLDIAFEQIGEIEF